MPNPTDIPEANESATGADADALARVRDSEFLERVRLAARTPGKNRLHAVRQLAVLERMFARGDLFFAAAPSPKLEKPEASKPAELEIDQAEYDALAASIVPHRDASAAPSRMQRRAVDAADRRDGRAEQRDRARRELADQRATRDRARRFTRASSMRKLRSERSQELYLERRRASYAQHATDAGIDRSEWTPRTAPRRTYVMTHDIIGDQAGRAPRIWLGRFRARYPIQVGKIERAALAPLPDGSTTYTYSDQRARRVVATALALLDMSERAPSQYGTRALPKRRGRWCHYVAGLTLGTLRAMLRDPYNGHVPSRSCVVGWHQVRASDARARPEGALIDGQIGYVPALELAGFCYRHQQRTERGDHLLSCERGYESGHPPTRYWIVGAPVDLENVAAEADVREAHRAGQHELVPALATRWQRHEGSALAWGLPPGPAPD